MLPKTYTIVDVETTGGSPHKDRMIEVGLIRIQNNEVIASYDTLINPQTYIPSLIQNLTGINHGHVEGAPLFEDIAQELLPFFDDAILVAHNANFDYRFLKEEFNRIKIPFAPRRICTVKLSRALYPNHRHHNLDSIIDRLDLTIRKRHRALDDAKAVWKFLQHVQTTFEPDVLATGVASATQQPMLPPHISKKTIEDLPSTYGVYTFYGENGSPLYIGKSNNIKERVLSHFSSANTSSKELRLSEQTTHIDSQTTAGELSALLLESKMIKEMQPIYNKKLRRSSELVIAKSQKTQEGYERITLQRQENISLEEFPTVVGIFKSIKQAKNQFISLTKEYNLCDKLLGLENTTRACFGHRLNRCNGACVSAESPEAYNARFHSAFHNSKLRTWPYTTPIVVKERNEDTEQEALHVIDKWCYLGSVVPGDSFEDLSPHYTFDLDAYRILYRYIMNIENEKQICLLPQVALSSQ